MIEALSDTTSSDRSSSVLTTAPTQSPCYHQSPRYSMDKTQSFQIFFTFSAKEHPGYQFWVHVEWEKPVLQELSSIIKKLLKATHVELAALIGAHVGLKLGKDLTCLVIQYFSSSSDCLLILDNLETLWEPVEFRGKTEEFLSLLTDVELVQSKLPIDNILGCKAALIRTSLAYSDEHKRLKTLVPIREYMQKIQPPGDHLIQPLLKHFQELLEFFTEYQGNETSSSTVTRVSSNYSKIQNVLQNGLQQGHPDLVNNLAESWGKEAYFSIECFNSWVFSISNPETLASNALGHFKEFDDPDLKCNLYNALASYYRVQGDTSSATKFCVAVISLALSTGNTKWHSQGLQNLAWVKWNIGAYSAAQVHANEAQRLAIISADLYREAQALNIEAICCYTLGNYTKAILYSIMTTQAVIHQLKSEYVEARSIHTGILEKTSIQDPHIHCLALINVAEIDVMVGALKDDVWRNCDRARKISDTLGNVEVAMCDVILADLYLRVGNPLAAQSIYERHLKMTLEYSQVQTYCLEWLGDASCWGGLDGMSNWTTVFLCILLKEKVGIYKALRSFGDIFLAQHDEHTATNISMGHGDPLKAVEFWEMARPLFECSLQTKQVHGIDERIANISEDPLEQHRNNLAHLAELHVQAGTAEALEDDLSEIEGLDKVDIGDEKELGSIVA
ncbi:hypothetical protein B0H13DRAFT_1883582 [Mycena leptocephala]|nr:hypothetical protein B0H13DRAFT_1883582 [Mycena leptocephala]